MSLTEMSSIDRVALRVSLGKSRTRVCDGKGAAIVGAV
jgi:hypothetical protein